MTKGKDHPPGGDDFFFWRGEVQGRNSLPDREGGALRKVQEQGSARVQGGSRSGPG